MKRAAAAPQLVRVIRDVRDARRDYLLPLEKARQLLAAGKLELIEAYKDKLSYAEKRREK